VPAPRSTDQIASLPPAQTQVETPVLRIEFAGAASGLSGRAEQALARLADDLNRSEERLQIKAFAGGGSGNGSNARRVSLSRALAVRAYLLEKGIRSTRIDVRALGQAGDNGPVDRVDIVLIGR
jgi:outer membrane protein OmpA-like peptidoglycan-associated protein